MRVLVNCEESATVRDALRSRGVDALSCDLQPTRGDPQWHIQADALDVAYNYGPWAGMIAHPPCTYLSVSGQRWCSGDSPKAVERRALREDAIRFFQALLDAPIPKLALENPVSIISSRIRKPDQTFHPYHFGDPHEKRTCLWLKNLPPLHYTNCVSPLYHVSGTGRRWSKWFWDTSMLPPAERSRVRSVTFQGIANAMADQWSPFFL